MFKNIIIIFLFFLLCSLLIQKPDNAKLLIKDLATSKEMVIEGAEYIHKTFDREFSVHSEEEYQKEHGEDKTSFIPFAGGSNVVIREQTVVEDTEDTWFNEN